MFISPQSMLYNRLSIARKFWAIPSGQSWLPDEIFCEIVFLFFYLHPRRRHYCFSYKWLTVKMSVSMTLSQHKIPAKFKLSTQFFKLHHSRFVFYSCRQAASIGKGFLFLKIYTFFFVLQISTASSQRVMLLRVI